MKIVEIFLICFAAGAAPGCLLYIRARIVHPEWWQK